MISDDTDADGGEFAGEAAAEEGELEADGEAAPERAWTSDEERAAAATKPSRRSSRGKGKPEPPPDADPAWSDVAKASAPEPRRSRTITIAGKERALRRGEYEESRFIDVPLSQDERIEHGTEMVALLDEARAKEAALKAHVRVVKGQLTSLEERATLLGRMLSTGVQARAVDVVILREDRTDEIVVVRKDTGDVVESRAMTLQERQEQLLTFDELAVQARRAAEHLTELGPARPHGAEEPEAEKPKARRGRTPKVATDAPAHAGEG